MIEYTDGSIFDSRAEVLTVPVNCEGVAGKGLALEFRRRYPYWHDAYLEAYAADQLRPGVPVWHGFGNVRFVSFPTKGRWREKSRADWVYGGLKLLRERAEVLGVVSLAVPALGAGLGGLDWEDVRGMIEARFGDFAGTVEVYAPKG